MIWPGFMPLASMIATIGTVRCAAWAKTRSMSGVTSSWSSNTLPALVGSHIKRRLGDDLDVGRLLAHHLLEAFLDVEGVVVAGIAQDLQHLALGRAVPLLQQPDRLAGGDLADLDRAGDRGQLERGRADLPVEVEHLDAGRPRLLDAGHDGVEIDRVHDDRRRAWCGSRPRAGGAGGRPRSGRRARPPCSRARRTPPRSPSGSRSGTRRAGSGSCRRWCPCPGRMQDAARPSAIAVASSEPAWRRVSFIGVLLAFACSDVRRAVAGRQERFAALSGGG